MTKSPWVIACLLAALSGAGLVGCGQSPKTPPTGNPAGSQPVPAAASAPAPQATTGTDLLADGSFEKGLDGWTGSNALVHRVLSPAHEGQYVLRVETTGDAYAGLMLGAEKLNHPNGTLTVTPGKGYEASFYVMSGDDLDEVEVQLVVTDNLGRKFNVAKLALDKTWQRIALKFKTHADTQSIALQLVKRNIREKAVFLVDSASLIEIPDKK